MLHGLSSPTGEAPEGFSDLKSAMTSFEGVKAVDKQNESKPSAAKMESSRQYRRRQTLEDIHSPK